MFLCTVRDSTCAQTIIRCLPAWLSGSDSLPIDFVLDRRLWISWLPRLRFCGRCRNLEITIMITNTARGISASQTDFVIIYMKNKWQSSLKLHFVENKLTNILAHLQATQCVFRRLRWRQLDQPLRPIEDNKITNILILFETFWFTNILILIQLRLCQLGIFALNKCCIVLRRQSCNCIDLIHPSRLWVCVTHHHYEVI